VHRQNAARVPLGEHIEKLARAVGAAVVDHHDAVLDAGRRQRRQEVVDGGLEVVLLAIGGHDDRHALDLDVAATSPKCSGDRAAVPFQNEAHRPLSCRTGSRRAGAGAEAKTSRSHTR
jgi:hypothetical protein